MPNIVDTVYDISLWGNRMIIPIMLFNTNDFFISIENFNFDTFTFIDKVFFFFIFQILN